MPVKWVVKQGDCIDLMRRSLPDGYVDAIVTDPPYGLGFMGKKWDSLPPGKEWAEECFRVLKPGGHLLAFGGTRTYHRLAVAIEDAGFEIRDCLAWMYGQGFPKSLDVSKAIDKAAGAEREIVGPSARHVSGKPTQRTEGLNGSSTFAETVGMCAYITAPATDDARTWAGWGTALKPAFEPIVVARKPLTGTVAANVLEYGTGAVNVDGCRIGTEGGTRSESRGEQQGVTYAAGALAGDFGKLVPGLGRWPANVVLDEEAAALLDEQADASRFFYVAKASKKERNAGLDGFEPQVASVGNHEAAGRDPENPANYVGGKRERVERGEPATEPRANHHPTVKPVALMRWLVRLVTPPGGRVLDPFCGSGTTGIAAVLEGFNFGGFEMEEEYANIARARIEHWLPESLLPSGAKEEGGE